MVARFRGCSWHLDRGAPLTYCLAMPEIAPVSQSVSKGWMALSRGSWKEARASFEQELEAGESAEALEGLSWAAWWLDDADTVFEARERAYRRYRERRDPASAARMATWLAADHLDFHGALAVASGWLGRAGAPAGAAGPRARSWLACLPRGPVGCQKSVGAVTSSFRLTEGFDGYLPGEVRRRDVLGGHPRGHCCIGGDRVRAARLSV